MREQESNLSSRGVAGGGWRLGAKGSRGNKKSNKVSGRPQISVPGARECGREQDSTNVREESKEHNVDFVLNLRAERYLGKEARREQEGPRGEEFD